MAIIREEEPRRGAVPGYDALNYNQYGVLVLPPEEAIEEVVVPPEYGNAIEEVVVPPEYGNAIEDVLPPEEEALPPEYALVPPELLRLSSALTYSLQHSDSYVGVINKASSAFGHPIDLDKDSIGQRSSYFQLFFSLYNNAHHLLKNSIINALDRNTDIFNFEDAHTNCLVKGAISGAITGTLYSSTAAGLLDFASSTAQCALINENPKIALTLGILSPAYNLASVVDRHDYATVTDIVRIADIATEGLTVEYVTEYMESMKNSALGALGYSHTDEL